MKYVRKFRLQYDNDTRNLDGQQVIYACKGHKILCASMPRHKFHGVPIFERWIANGK